MPQVYPNYPNLINVNGQAQENNKADTEEIQEINDQPKIVVNDNMSDGSKRSSEIRLTA